MLRALLLLCALAVSTACTAEVAPTSTPLGVAQQAIINGEDDDGHPAIVALIAEDGDVYCTGVLINSYTVATAAHCLAAATPARIFFGADPNEPAADDYNVVEVAGTKIHPDFDEETLENDIGLVALMTKAPAKPLPILTSPLDDSYVGVEIRLIGFGTEKSGATTNLRKREGTTEIESYDDTTFRFVPNPSQTCNGDSGGPALARIDGREVVIGITSAGDAECMTYGRHTRIDVFANFVKSYAVSYATKATQPKVASQGCSFGAATTKPLPPMSIAAALCVLMLRRGRRRSGAWQT